MSEKKPCDIENRAVQENKKPVKGKKRKKAKVSAKLAAVLLVIAVVFGVVLGFTLGRGSSRSNEAETNLGEQASFSDTEGLTDENIDALNLLSGEEAIFGDDEAQLGYEEDSSSSVVVAEFKGGQLMSSDVASTYNDQVAGYIFSGYTEEDIPESLLTDLLSQMAEEKVLENKARELGVYELTDQDMDAIAEDAEQTMEDMISIFRSVIDPTGKDESAIVAETKEYLRDYEGISYDSVFAILSESRWVEKLYDEIVKDVQIESADIIELYNEKMDAQKAGFSEYPEDFESTQMSGETIVYNLDGYRAVRLLAIYPKENGASDTAAIIEEEISMLDPEKDAKTIADYSAELDELYASSEAAMQEVQQQIAGGAKFSDMLDAYGEDIGMQIETLKKTGYYVSESSLLWPQQMIDAAFSLANPGDISGSFRMNGSVCILEYVGEVVPGEISIDAMYDTLSQEALEYARAEAYEAQVDKWIAEAEIKYYPERMR